MEQLKNINHTFDMPIGDVGVTIRKGSKWAVIEKGRNIELWVCSVAHQGECPKDGCNRAGYGKIIGYWSGEFSKLPPSLLSIEHNKEARNIANLTAMMIQGYGSIQDNDIITALIYERTG